MGIRRTERLTQLYLPIVSFLYNPWFCCFRGDEILEFFNPLTQYYFEVAGKKSAQKGRMMGHTSWKKNLRTHLLVETFCSWGLTFFLAELCKRWWICRGASLCSDTQRAYFHMRFFLKESPFGWCNNLAKFHIIQHFWSLEIYDRN